MIYLVLTQAYCVLHIATMLVLFLLVMCTSCLSFPVLGLDLSVYIMQTVIYFKCFCSSQHVVGNCSLHCLTLTRKTGRMPVVSSSHALSDKLYSTSLSFFILIFLPICIQTAAKPEDLLSACGHSSLALLTQDKKGHRSGQDIKTTVFGVSTPAVPLCNVRQKEDNNPCFLKTRLVQACVG